MVHYVEAISMVLPCSYVSAVQGMEKVMIRKVLSLVGILSALGAPAAQAQAVYYSTPVYTAPVYAAPPVVYNTAPSVVYAQPTYVAPVYATPAYYPYYGGYYGYPSYYGGGLSLGFNFGGRGGYGRGGYGGGRGYR